MFLPWFSLVLEGMLCIVFSSSIAENDSTYCLLVILINAFILVFSISKAFKNTGASNIVLLGVIMRLILLMWDINFSYIYELPNSGKDSVMFANAARSGFMTGDYRRGGVYSQYIAFIYRFFGVQVPIAQYTNILFAMSMIYYVYLTMEYIGIDNRIQKTVLGLLSILPNTAITNSILLRESMIAFLVSFSVFYFVRWLYENNFGSFLLFIFSGAVVSLVHSGSFAILAAEAIIWAMFDRSSGHIKLKGRSIIAGIVLLLGMRVLFSQFGGTLFTKFQGIDSVEDIVNSVEIHGTGGAAYSAGFEIDNSIASLIINTPIRIFYFLFSPLPWYWRSLSDIIAFCFSSLVFIYSLYQAFKELRMCSEPAHKTWIIMFIIMALVSAFVFAWGVSNSGTAVRHREKFITIFVLLIAVVADSRKKRMNYQ